MKSLIHSFATRSGLLPTRDKTVALAPFWALAFLPAIWQLTRLDWPLAGPLAGLGPVAAGFWLADTLCGARLSFALLGISLSGLIGLVNWLMLAGNDCCSLG